LVVVALLGFFIVLGKIGVNWDRFPKDFFGSIFSLIFLVSFDSISYDSLIGINFGFAWSFDSFLVKN